MKIAMHGLFVVLLIKLLLNLVVIQINSYCFSEPTAHLLMKIVFVIIMKSSIHHILKLQQYCSDTWKQHSKQIKKYLQVIDIETVQKLNLKPGQKLSSHCYERVANNDNLNTADIPEDLDDSFYDYMLERNKSSFDAEAIGVSVIKKVSSRDKISNGRNKLKCIRVEIEEKVAQALDISAEELQPETRVDFSKCNDLDKLVELIRGKLSVSSRNEKVKMLTLTPGSWTIEKTMKEFEVSKYHVKKARSFKKELGILAEP